MSRVGEGYKERQTLGLTKRRPPPPVTDVQMETRYSRNNTFPVTVAVAGWLCNCGELEGIQVAGRCPSCVSSIPETLPGVMSLPLFLTVRTAEAAVAYGTPELPHGTAEIRGVASPPANGTAAAWAEPTSGTPALRTWAGTAGSSRAPQHDAPSAAPSLPSDAPPDAAASPPTAR